jgi:hypothetical protein
MHQGMAIRTECPEIRRRVVRVVEIDVVDMELAPIGRLKATLFTRALQKFPVRRRHSDRL